ncbi:MAG: peptidylprolyl isomerase [Candidatus Margulisbacteria bacterium]|nr:peptidylprolyl isomerase [Candidatus Margulisiibacteriota bacterium]
MLNFLRERAKEILTITVVLFVLSFLGIGAYSFLNQGNGEENKEEATSALGLLNGKPLDGYYYNRQFNQAFSNIPSEQRMLLDPDVVDYYRYQAFQETVANMLMMDEANREGIKVFPQEFNYRMEQLVKAYGLKNVGALKKLIKDNKIEWKVFKEQQKNDIIVSKFLGGITSRVRVTPLDREMAFTEAKVRHILIKVDQQATDNMEEDLIKLKKAETIYEMVLSNKKNFAKIAEKYSEDTASAEKGGDLGWVGRGQMVPEFESMLHTLTKGEIGGPIRTIYGYHIILVEDKREKDKPADLTDERVDQIILQQKQQEAIQEWLKPLKLSANIEIIDSQIKAYDYKVNQQYEEALIEYQKALMANSELLTYTQIARMLDRLGNKDEAIRAIRKALILQNRLQGYRYPSLYFAGLDLFIKYKLTDLYSSLIDDALVTFKGKEVVLSVLDKNYKNKMTKEQKSNLDEQLKLIDDQKKEAEATKKKDSLNPFSALEALDSLTENSLAK